MHHISLCPATPPVHRFRPAQPVGANAASRARSFCRHAALTALVGIALALALQAQPAPTVSHYSIIPAQPVAGQAGSVTISGANLDPATVEISFTSLDRDTKCPTTNPFACKVANAQLTAKSSTSVTAPFNLEAGSYFILVFHQGGNLLAQLSTLVIHPRPAATSYSSVPAAPVGGQPFSITVNGTSLEPNTVAITFTSNDAGSKCPATSPGLCKISNAQLSSKSATMIRGSISLDPGNYFVLVSNGDGPLMEVGAPLVVSPAVIPLTFTSFTTVPAAPAAGQRFTITANGASFDPNSVSIYFTSFDAGTKCPSTNPGLCAIPNAQLTSKSSTVIAGSITLDAGSYFVNVRNASGAPVSAGAQLVVASAPMPPTITSLTTTPAPPVAGQPLAITVNGANFDPSTVKITFTSFDAGTKCPASSPGLCAVSNAQLTAKSATMIRGSITLDAGSYFVLIGNGDAPPVQANTQLVVPAAGPGGEAVVTEVWTASAGGNIPSGSFVSGTENGFTTFLCRAQFNGGTQVGRVSPALGGCRFEFGRSGQVADNYETLTRGFFGQWIPAEGASIPNGALRIGTEAGQEMFACRAYHAPSNAIVPGKIRRDFTAGCAIEQNGSSFNIASYEVLRNAWTTAPADGQIPAGALQIGAEATGHPLYSCRGQIGGESVIGKTGAHLNGTCRAERNGNAQVMTSYAVLTNYEAIWVPVTAGSTLRIPTGAAVVGIENQPRYICRVSVNGSVQPGKLAPENGNCYFEFGNEGRSSRDYEVLVPAATSLGGTFKLFTKTSGRFLRESPADSFFTARTQEDDGFSRFSLARQANGSYRVVLQQSGNRLHDDPSSDHRISTRFQQADDDFSRFHFEREPEGSYRIRTTATNRYWSVDGGGFVVSNNPTTGDSSRFMLGSGVSAANCQYTIDARSFVLPLNRTNPVALSILVMPPAGGCGAANSSWSVANLPAGWTSTPTQGNNQATVVITVPANASLPQSLTVAGITVDVTGDATVCSLNSVFAASEGSAFGPFVAGATIAVRANGTVSLARDDAYSTDSDGNIVIAPSPNTGAAMFFTHNAAPVGIPPTAGQRKTPIAAPFDVAPFGALIGGVAPTSNSLPQTWFTVGRDFKVTMPDSGGYLVLRANDPAGTADNAGSFNVGLGCPVGGGCTFSVSPLTATPGADGKVAITVNTGATCRWTVSGLPAGWTADRMEVIGSGTVTITTTANTSATEKRSEILIANSTVLITQAGVPVGSPTLNAAPGSITFSGNENAREVALTGTNGAAFRVTAVTATGAGWLSVTPVTGTLPATITVRVNPAGLAAANYTGTVTVSLDNTNVSRDIAITLNAGSTVPVLGAVANAASNATDGVAPGMVVALYGSNLGPANLVGLELTPDRTAISTTLVRTRILFDGVPAPLIYVSSTQCSAIVPYGVANRATTEIVVEVDGQRSASLRTPVVAALPGIFSLDQTGGGAGAILGSDFRLNGPGNPVARGGTVLVYATGEGLVGPVVADGAVIGTDLSRPRLPVSATVGGVPARVDYAGNVAGLVAGVMQVNVVIPDTAPSGPAVPIVITVGTARSRADVTLSIR